MELSLWRILNMSRLKLSQQLCATININITFRKCMSKIGVDLCKRVISSRHFYFKTKQSATMKQKRGFYRPQTKLREGTVFTHVCLSRGSAFPQYHGSGRVPGLWPGDRPHPHRRQAVNRWPLRILLECIFVKNTAGFFIWDY